MVNPCYDCPKYREYGEYLDEVLICKSPVPAIVAQPSLVELTQKKKPVDVKAKPKKQAVQCQMIGCDGEAKYKGFCSKCRSARKYYVEQGKLPPVALTPAMIKKRGLKGV